ncbi:hypothetical protein ACU4GD_23430 [Cupriavidus basilensis]
MTEPKTAAGAIPDADYVLYGFAQSGNTYKVALLLETVGVQRGRNLLGAALRRLLQRRDAHPGVPGHQRDGRGAGARVRRPEAVAIGRHPRRAGAAAWHPWPRR